MLLDYWRWDHAIELVPGANSKLSKAYPLSFTKQSELDAFFC